MDITWATIGKLLLTGLSTYVVFPAVLIFRDYLLWKFIDYFILNEKLHEKIRGYAIRANMWNETYAIKKSKGIKDGKGTYTLNGKEVTQKQWNDHKAIEDDLRKYMQTDMHYIKRKAVFLSWLLKHYKQDESNPIDGWLKDAIERASNQHENDS